MYRVRHTMVQLALVGGSRDGVPKDLHYLLGPFFKLKCLGVLLSKREVLLPSHPFNWKSPNSLLLLSWLVKVTEDFNSDVQLGDFLH